MKQSGNDGTAAVVIGDRVRVINLSGKENTETYKVVWISQPIPGLGYRRVNIQASSGDRFLVNEGALERVAAQ